ncbi:MAG: nucleotide exchange factor GrpE [Spirochaetaceae bacterium]|nr:nucleotide exchange factor GrpE [Spirochaetaceae bacterium]
MSNNNEDWGNSGESDIHIHTVTGETDPDKSNAGDQSQKTEGCIPQGDEVPENEKGESSLTVKIAELEKQNAELKDQYLRKAADFDNYRKRTIKEKQEAIDFANQSLLLDLIPIIDDFERAIKAAEESAKSEAEFENLKTGIKMIEQRLYSTLENKWGLKRFNSVGELFDPLRHEALSMEKSPDVTEAMVREDFMKGYTLKDRVVRPSKVKVLMPEGNG